MATPRVLVEGACENFILPCRTESFYADATSCVHYYRCLDYRVWRQECPTGTISMQQGKPKSCIGNTAPKSCDHNNPRGRCLKVRPGQYDWKNENCNFKISLPCKDETKFLDPDTCDDYFTCKLADVGEVLDRKPCDLPARCRDIKKTKFCSMTDSKQRCPLTGSNNGATIAGAVLGSLAILLILLGIGFLLYRRRNGKQRRSTPASSADSVGSPAANSKSDPPRPESGTEMNHYATIDDMSNNMTSLDTSEKYEILGSRQSYGNSAYTTLSDTAAGGNRTFPQYSTENGHPKNDYFVLESDIHNHHHPNEHDPREITASVIRDDEGQDLSAPIDPLENQKDGAKTLGIEDVGQQEPTGANNYFILEESKRDLGNTDHNGQDNSQHSGADTRFVLESQGADLKNSNDIAPEILGQAEPTTYFVLESQTNDERSSRRE